MCWAWESHHISRGSAGHRARGYDAVIGNQSRDGAGLPARLARGDPQHRLSGRLDVSRLPRGMLPGDVNVAKAALDPVLAIDRVGAGAGRGRPRVRDRTRPAVRYGFRPPVPAPFRRRARSPTRPPIRERAKPPHRDSSAWRPSHCPPPAATMPMRARGAIGPYSPRHEATPSPPRARDGSRPPSRAHGWKPRPDFAAPGPRGNPWSDVPRQTSRPSRRTGLARRVPQPPLISRE